MEGGRTELGRSQPPWPGKGGEGSGKAAGQKAPNAERASQEKLRSRKRGASAKVQVVTAHSRPRFRVRVGQQPFLTGVKPLPPFHFSSHWKILFSVLF